MNNKELGAIPTSYNDEQNVYLPHGSVIKQKICRLTWSHFRTGIDDHRWRPTWLLQNEWNQRSIWQAFWGVLFLLLLSHDIFFWLNFGQNESKKHIQTLSRCHISNSKHASVVYTKSHRHTHTHIHLHSISVHNKWKASFILVLCQTCLLNKCWLQRTWMAGWLTDWLPGWLGGWMIFRV